jgi:Txe/YoeB family toxin of toxin-antitoxin system
VKHTVVYSKQAQKDSRKLKKSNLKEAALELIKVLEKDPFQNPPRYEALRGELKGCYSRRINIQHRLVYEVLEEEKIVHVLRMWTHYE